jgi:hypothetical protein
MLTGFGGYRPLFGAVIALAINGGTLDGTYRVTRISRNE